MGSRTVCSKPLSRSSLVWIVALGLATGCQQVERVNSKTTAVPPSSPSEPFGSSAAEEKPEASSGQSGEEKKEEPSDPVCETLEPPFRFGHSETGEAAIPFSEIPFGDYVAVKTELFHADSKRRYLYAEESSNADASREIAWTCKPSASSLGPTGSKSRAFLALDAFSRQVSGTRHQPRLFALQLIDGAVRMGQILPRTERQASATFVKFLEAHDFETRIFSAGENEIELQLRSKREDQRQEARIRFKRTTDS